jgi:hypothetical protein
MRPLPIWLAIAAVSAASASAEAQAPLKQLKLEAPPTHTLFCSAGEQVQLSLVGIDEKQARTSLEGYKVSIRSSNPGVASAQGRAPTWATIDAACRADGEAWILVDANGTRGWMRVLVGSARATPVTASGPPESAWTETVATTKLVAPVGTLSSPTLQTRSMIPRTLAAAPVATLTLSATPATIEHGSAQTIVATPRDAAGSALSGRAVTWQSSKPAVATVDANGTVTGVEVGGPVTITATSDTASASATISITAIRPSGYGGQTLVTAPVTVLTPGGTVQISDYFAAGEGDKFYAVRPNWQQPAGCTGGAAFGPAVSVRLSAIPAGRQYQTFLMRDYATVVQQSQPSGQDQNFSMMGTCGASAPFYIHIHKTSGLPTSNPFRITLSYPAGP